jgi:hypothetical protein
MSTRTGFRCPAAGLPVSGRAERYPVAEEVTERRRLGAAVSVQAPTEGTVWCDLYHSKRAVRGAYGVGVRRTVAELFCNTVDYKR